MLEALTLFTVASLCGLALVVVKLRARNRRPSAEEVQRLREHLAWLEERQRHAVERRWDADMQSRLATQIAETQAKLAAANPPADQGAARR